MQPLLLMKQTLEVAYDPGPLLLNGPLVRVHEAKGLFWRGKAKEDVAAESSIEIEGVPRSSFRSTFSSGKSGITLLSTYHPGLRSVRTAKGAEEAFRGQQDKVKWAHLVEVVRDRFAFVLRDRMTVGVGETDHDVW